MTRDEGRCLLRKTVAAAAAPAITTKKIPRTVTIGDIHGSPLVCGASASTFTVIRSVLWFNEASVART
jgi:hypothetical protein